MGNPTDLKELHRLANHWDLIRTGKLVLGTPAAEQLIRTGQCGPPQATQLQSWGSACPPGWCGPDTLPEILGRYRAGEREGCRELPFGLEFTAAGAGTVTINDSAPVTMCPTRLIAIASAGTWTINTIQFGNTNQMVGGPAPATAFAPDAIQLVPMVPDCLRAGQPYTITVEKLELGAGSLNLIFIGPAAG